MKKSILALSSIALTATCLFPGVAMAASQSGGYLLASKTEVLFIQLTVAGNVLSGSAQESYIDTSGLNPTLESAHYGLSGVIQGRNVSISIQNSGNYSGTLTNGILTLSIPQSNGNLATAPFTYATVAHFDQDVDVLRQEIQRQEHSLDLQSNVDNADQRFVQAGHNLTGALYSLTGWAVNTQENIPNIRRDLGFLAQDEQTLLSDAKTAETPDSIANDIEQLQSNELVLSADAESDIKVSQIPSWVSRTNAAVSAYLSAYRNLVSVAKTDPDYRPDPPIPAQDAVNRSVESAHITTQNDIIKLKKYGAQTAGLISSGYAQAQQAISEANKEQKAYALATAAAAAVASADQLAPQLQGVLQQGNTAGSTQISVPIGFDPSQDQLEYVFVNSPTPVPELTAQVPAGAIPYVYFSDISMIGNTAKYMDVYEVDHQGHLVAFVELPITASVILPAN
ncbi:MAG: hypothetical protein OWU32_13455 [Firmicutes bacterium]|nr:hypothetical protein [Bacillota bacterium]